MLYTEDTEPPYLFRKWTGISVIAATLQRRCYLSWEGKIYPNMYIVLVGPSGTRKTTAMRDGYIFIQELGLDVASDSTTREALIRKLKTISRDDFTKEGRPISHSSLTIFSEELSVFLGYSNLQLITDLTNWYDCKDRWDYDTKTQGRDDITGIWVNLIGATTPGILQSSLPMDAVGGGLTARMVFVYEESKGKWIIIPKTTKELSQIKENLSFDLGKIHMKEGEFHFHESYIDRWIKWYPTSDKLSAFSDERFGGYLQRRPTHLRKLCMIFNASRIDGKMIITAEDFDKALNLLMMTERKMRFTLSGVGKCDIAILLSRIILLLTNKKEVKFSDLLRMFYYDADDFTMRKVIVTLEKMKVCKVVASGSDSIIYYIEEEKK